MMSGYSAPVDPSVLAGVGVREVLEKPISQVALAEKVCQALEGRARRGEARAARVASER